jgi:hypothetical protein
MNQKIITLRILAFALRLVSHIVSRWLLLLVAAFFLSPIGPHLRAEYTYYEVGNTRMYLRCTYLGSRGFITPDFRGDCPLFVILNANEWR